MVSLKNTGVRKSRFQTSDGAVLNILERGGEGCPILLMIPGWSQTAAMFGRQLEGLSKNFHCIAMDSRGHGDSTKVGHGYRISRLTMDVREFIVDRDLTDIVLLGHSMGNQLLWCYWDFYQGDRLKAMIMVDQPPVVMGRDGAPEDAKAEAGYVLTYAEVDAVCQGLLSEDGEDFTKQFVAGMLSPSLARSSLFEWIVSENLKLPREHAGELFWNGAAQDWRDVIRTISLPTLVVGGEASLISQDSLVWIHEHIEGSELKIFSTSDGGYHFPFLENSCLFNECILSFLSIL